VGENRVFGGPSHAPISGKVQKFEGDTLSFFSSQTRLTGGISFYLFQLEERFKMI